MTLAKNSGTLFAGLIIASLAGLLLFGCTSAQQQSATDVAQRVVADGQLFCAKATTYGPVVVALADASGVPVIVTGKAAQWVADACAAIGAFPVVPPPQPGQAPVVAAAVPTV